MRFLRRVPRRLPRHLLAVAALLAQLVAAAGAPVVAPRAKKVGEVPFPCQDHPCGCLTADECWAGDCCCFTLEEKVAWAAARGTAAPEHARALVEARKGPPKRKAKPKHACCAECEKPACCQTATEPAPTEQPAATATPAAPAIKWVVGDFVRKCRGDGPAGVLKLAVAVPPAPSLAVRAPRPACGRVEAGAPTPIVTPLQPPIPPPRLS